MRNSLHQVRKLAAFFPHCANTQRKAHLPVLWQKRYFTPSISITAFSAVDTSPSLQILVPKSFRCDKSDPIDHTLDDEGLFYTIPEKDLDVICPKPCRRKAFSKRYIEEMNSFNEAAFMVRKPALEVINYMKHADYSMPMQRYLLYGDSGTGKSVTLQHITHYCLKRGWLIVPTLQAWDWVTHKSHYKPTQREEILESLWNENMFDQPVRATAWLELFKSMNEQHLINIKSSNEYVWSKRESTKSGTPLSVLVDQGIARPRISTDVIGCIMKEIRTQPVGNLPRVLVTVDCVNALFSKTNLKIKMRASMDAKELTFIKNLKSLIADTRANGAVVTAMNSSYTTDEAKMGQVHEAQFTYEVLGHEGFDVLDPHIPVEVPNYNSKEVLSQLAYYEDRKWLAGRAATDDARREILELSCNNPWEVAKICGGLF